MSFDFFDESSPKNDLCEERKTSLFLRQVFGWEAECVGGPLCGATAEGHFDKRRKMPLLEHVGEDGIPHRYRMAWSNRRRIHYWHYIGHVSPEQCPAKPFLRLP